MYYWKFAFTYTYTVAYTATKPSGKNVAFTLLVLCCFTFPYMTTPGPPAVQQTDL